MLTDPTQPSDSTNSNSAYVYDSESPEEMTRLFALHRIITQATGGPFAGLPDLSPDARILDLACGPGGWVLDVAFALPHALVAGVDISRMMVDYANARARSEGRTNASFGVMDIRQPLDFSDGSFDLINARMIVAALYRENWAPLLTECARLLRPGGILRLTECDEIGRTTSAAFEQLGILSAKAFQAQGYGFSPDGNTFGIAAVLPRLLANAGFQNRRYYAYPLHFFYGSDGFSDLKKNSEISAKNIEPLLLKHKLCTLEVLDHLRQEMYMQWLADDFCGTWTFWNAVGTKPAS